MREDGFTIIELLLVFLVVAILAALALPQFLGQTAKAQDADAKANASNLYKQVESCFAETEDYRLCETGDADLGDHGHSVGTGAGEVAMQAFNRSQYSLVSRSQTTTRFFIVRVMPDAPTKACDRNEGGCRANSW